jgi:hydroxymethylbilane synthase
LITRTAVGSLADLPARAIIGTGSVRRHSQLLALRPDLRTLDIRGNIDTRLQKLARGPYDALVLACAGLNRLGLSGRISFRFGLEQMLPAPGQGALALEGRKGDASVRVSVAHLSHAPAAAAAAAERAFLRRVGGGCSSPVAAHAQPEGEGLRIEGLVAALDGTRVIRKSAWAPAETAEAAATDLAESVLRDGGAEILASAG